MSEHENELKKALAENGVFDADKASNDADRARRWFDSRLKWSGRISWVRIILVLIVFEFALVNLVDAVSTRAMIGYAAMMVITIVLIGAIAVQSWVSGTKISLLREIKLLRLECLGRPAAQDASSALKAFSKTTSTRWALGFWEFIIWILITAMIGGASAYVSHRLSANIWPMGMARFEGAPVTIEAPRLGAPIYFTIYLRMNQGQCKVSQVTPQDEEKELFKMGEGFVSKWTLSPGDSLRLDPQDNEGEYWVRFE
jgi:hypothetical protein